MKKGLEEVDTISYILYIISYHPPTKTQWFLSLPFVSFLSYWLIPLAKIFSTLSSSPDILSFTLFLRLPTEDYLAHWNVLFQYSFSFSTVFLTLPSIPFLYSELIPLIHSAGYILQEFFQRVINILFWLCPPWDIGTHLKLFLWIFFLNFI